MSLGAFLATQGGAAAISGVGGLLGSALGVSGQKQQYKYQRALMEQQYQNQIDFWNMNNEYNTPAAQMARYAEAGVNPYVALGHGNTSQYGSVMQPTPQAPNYAGSVGAQIQQALQNFLLLQQARNIGADTNLKDAQVNTQESLQQLQKVQSFVLRQDGNLKSQLYEFREIVNDPLSKIPFEQYNLLVKKNKTELLTQDFMGLQMDVTKEEKAKIQALTKKLEEEAKIPAAQIQVYLAQAAALRVQTAINAAELPYAASNAFSRSNILHFQDQSADFNLRLDYLTFDQKVDYLIKYYKAASSKADWAGYGMFPFFNQLSQTIWGTAGPLPQIILKK